MRRVHWPAFWRRFLDVFSNPYLISFYAGMIYALLMVWLAGYAN